MKLLWTDMSYHRYIYKNGKPASDIMGGLITLCYATDSYSDLVLRWMTKENEDNTWEEVDKMKEGKVCFYDNGFDYPPTKTYQFSDAHLIYFKAIFNAEGKEPMQTILTISPAIQNYGVELVKRWNHSWAPPSESTPHQTVENTDEFYLNIKHLKNKKTLVPMGIPAFEGTPENDQIEFEFEIIENDIDNFQIDFLHGDKVIQSYFSAKQTLDEVVITAKGSGKKSGTNGAKSENTPNNNYPKGKYSIKWDGFDRNGIYDSALFTSGKLKARIKGKRNGEEKTAETSEFSFEHKEVNWVDVKINKNTKRIDVTLRINLKDGGARGLNNWDGIPKKDLITGKPPLKTQIKSFKELEKLAIEGVNYHWSRNQNHAVAKSVDIDGEKYEVFVHAVNTTGNAMDDVDLIFNTNRKWMRSGNPGTVEDPISFIGNIVSREAICYNVGYIKYTKRWEYNHPNDEDLEFKFTSAHEIGHTILKAYGGTFYSYGHKGSVNTITQSESPEATKYPKTGEIDIMPYYTNVIPYHKYNNFSAASNDVLSLIWLTKIELK